MYTSFVKPLIWLKKLRNWPNTLTSGEQQDVSETTHWWNDSKSKSYRDWHSFCLWAILWIKTKNFPEKTQKTTHSEWYLFFPFFSSFCSYHFKVISKIVVLHHGEILHAWLLISSKLIILAALNYSGTWFRNCFGFSLLHAECWKNLSPLVIQPTGSVLELTLKLFQ